MFAVPFDTPVTTPLTGSTVATAGTADVNPNQPPEMNRLLASLPRAISATVPLMAMVVGGGLLAGASRAMDASTCDTVSCAPGVAVKPCAVA